jgi:cyclic lactone autoinducer peptide
MKKVLALNYSASAALKRKYQLLVGALPMLCMFAPFVPMLKVAYWLDSPAGAAYNPAANDSPFLLLWGILGLVVMISALLIGHAFGWLLNMAVSALLLRWPWHRIRAVYLESQLPADWYKDGIASQGQADALAGQEWEELRSRGFVSFLLKRGILSWGAPMFLAMYVLPTSAKGNSVTLAGLLTNVGIWVVAGGAFGACMWWWYESQHRKRSRR